MNTILRPAVALVLLFTLLTGLALPLGITGIAHVAMPYRAEGSLIERDGRVVGSALVGQNFADAKYFHPRESATVEDDPAAAGKTRAAPYNASNSAASQQGPTNQALLDAVRERVKANGPAPVPADAATASGSGLDPHVSPENALRQVARVAGARGMPEDRVRALVAANTEGRELGFLGEPRVNVLGLNLALDAAR